MRLIVITFISFNLFAVTARAQQSLPPKMPITYEPLRKSLTNLLDSGWSVVANGSNGTFLRNGQKWAICAIDAGQGIIGGPSSYCWGLN
jgi:hypothetical protein